MVVAAPSIQAHRAETGLTVYRAHSSHGEMARKDGEREAPSYSNALLEETEVGSNLVEPYFIAHRQGKSWRRVVALFSKI